MHEFVSPQPIAALPVADLFLIDFLDHVMRQWPSERMELIKRNFYPRDADQSRIDDMIVVRKGIYSAFRLGQVRPLLSLMMCHLRR